MSDWDRYRFFLAVAEHRSFSAAARVLRSSQPTVGRVIAAFEDELGTRLFARTSRGLVPTPEAERMLDDARRMAIAARDAERRAKGSTTGIDGKVRISVTEGVGLWLTREVHVLRKTHPNLRVELLVSSRAVDLPGREADLAIRLFRPREPYLVVRRAGSLRFGLYASPAYLRSRGTPRRLTDLARHDLVGFSSGIPWPEAARWLHRTAPEERFVFRSDSLLAQHEAARAGLGIALGTVPVLDGDPKLTRVLPRASPPALDVHIVAHEDVRRSQTVGAVMEILHQRLTSGAFACG